jgi:5-methyltetrahydropteroyltriglutamate--homocysteine methyltransferase
VAATTIGSFPRPRWLAETIRGEVVFRIEGASLHEAQDDATIIALQRQERLGLDLLTDGEQRRPSFINHFLSGLEGVDLVNRAEREIRRRSGNLRAVPRIVGKVARRTSIAATDLRFAVSQTQQPIKVAVPGPLTIIDTTVDDAYHDERSLAMDLAAAVNAELLDLQAAGCAIVQIDEPAMTRYHEKTAEYGAEALDRCLEGVTVPSIIHLCYGYAGSGAQQYHFEYPELLETLMQTRIGGFSLEFARSGYDPSILQICPDRLIVFGCVDPGEGPPEPLDLVIDRVRAALRYVDPSRLLIAPDCGMMTIDRELAWQKAAMLVAAARKVRWAL